MVARGDAELGFQQMSELLPVPGIDLVGPLPPDVQEITTFTACVPVRAQEPQAAQALVAHLKAAATFLSSENGAWSRASPDGSIHTLTTPADFVRHPSYMKEGKQKAGLKPSPPPTRRGATTRRRGGQVERLFSMSSQ